MHQGTEALRTVRLMSSDLRFDAVGDGMLSREVGGRIELAHVAWVPPKGGIETTFRFRH